MWYFVWFLGVLLASSFSILSGLWLERQEAAKDEESEH